MQKPKELKQETDSLQGPTINFTSQVGAECRLRVSHVRSARGKKKRGIQSVAVEEFVRVSLVAFYVNEIMKHSLEQN